MYTVTPFCIFLILMHHKTLILRNTNEKNNKLALTKSVWSVFILLLFAVTENKQQLIKSIGYGQTQDA